MLKCAYYAEAVLVWKIMFFCSNYAKNYAAQSAQAYFGRVAPKFRRCPSVSCRNFTEAVRRFRAAVPSRTASRGSLVLPAGNMIHSISYGAILKVSSDGSILKVCRESLTSQGRERSSGSNFCVGSICCAMFPATWSHEHTRVTAYFHTTLIWSSRLLVQVYEVTWPSIPVSKSKCKVV